VVIASAYRTEDPGFESRQGVGLYTYIAAVVKTSHALPLYLIDKMKCCISDFLWVRLHVGGFFWYYGNVHPSPPNPSPPHPSLSDPLPGNPSPPYPSPPNPSPLI
jgi:hypothetical protein